MAGKAKHPRKDLAALLEREVKKQWQPQFQAKARKRATTTGGIVIDTRARLGGTAPIGSTDQDRIRHRAARTTTSQDQSADSFSAVVKRL